MKQIGKNDLWIKMFALQNEAQKRRLAATLALELGWGGITKVKELTGMSITTIRKGVEDIHDKDEMDLSKRIRKPGGGRKRIDIKDPKLIEDFKAIMDENTAGDPMNSLKWTNKSTYSIANELNAKKHKIAPDTVGRLLKESGYSLQANSKTKEGGTDPERDCQFRYINKQVKKFSKNKNPVISVDTKKKELVGDFKNQGKTWRIKGKPIEVGVYDFLTRALGVAIPYGIYDVSENRGFVNIGVTYDTSEFAVESIRQWWNILGKNDYSNPNGLLICCDSGGSNGSRRKGWKYYLQKLTDEIKMPITVCHLPPGTSKWNKIEHRMFSFISINWKGKPLVNYETIINLISSTTTKKGLTILARLDDGQYEKGRKFTEDEMLKININQHKNCPKWNYTIRPRTV